jgi:hypothetical protein
MQGLRKKGQNEHSAAGRVGDADPVRAGLRLDCDGELEVALSSHPSPRRRAAAVVVGVPAAERRCAHVLQVGDDGQRSRSQ